MKQFAKTSPAEVIALARSNYFIDRTTAALDENAGEDVLSLLVKDEFSSIRVKVARRGYGLDILVNDPEWRIRRVVAEQGYGLEKLVHDPEAWVRVAVAEQGYGLDVLLHDKDVMVRVAVAEQGYGLDTLIKDPVRKVREVVASTGYGLDTLMNDSDGYIRAAAKAYKDNPSLLGHIEVVDKKDCFIQAEHEYYLICAGRELEECKHCPQYVNWTPDNKHD